MGSSGGKEYKESPETRALTAQQTALLKDIQGTVQQFDPMTFSLMGLKQATTQVVNPAWESWSKQSSRYKNRTAEPEQYISKTSWVPMTEEERVATLQGTDRQLYDLQQLQYQRLLDSYNGVEGVSPSLEASLLKQRQQLEETMAQKLGSNWATSTPGIQAMSEFEKNAELQRETARQNEIASGQSLLMQNLGYQTDTSQQKLSNFVNVPSARYQGNLNAGQGLLNSMIQRDAAKNSYNAQTQGGSAAAGAASGAMSGALGGAMIGAKIGSGYPGIGTAIGAVVGGIGGLLAGR